MNRPTDLAHGWSHFWPLFTALCDAEVKKAACIEANTFSGIFRVFEFSQGGPGAGSACPPRALAAGCQEAAVPLEADPDPAWGPSVLVPLLRRGNCGTPLSLFQPAHLPPLRGRCTL